MATFTGGDAAEIITPATVSPGVIAVGAARPSSAGDAIFGGAGNDTIDGGRGDDYIAGGLDADLLSGGEGNDAFAWSPGDGSDTIDGGKGVDALLFQTGDVSEIISLANQAGHAILTRDVGLVTLDLDNVERVVFTGAPGGADRFVIGDLSATEVRQVEIDLGSAGGGDGQADVVALSGGSAGEALALATSGGVTSVSGLAAAVRVGHAESIDRLAIAAGGGGDTLDASAIAGGVTVNFDGGEGADVLALRGGAGNDTVGVFGGQATPEGDAILLDVNGAAGQVNTLSVETFTVDTGTGDDLISASNYQGSAKLVITAGDGNDTAFG
ncbi:MAG TPA: hypothetical protein VGD44_26030, partial [Phenylobacterium sp.]